MNRNVGIYFLAVGLVISFASPTLARGVSGKATVYADRYHGKKTASGKRYNKNAMTAASARLPMGSKVVVKNKKNGRSAVVVVNDKMASGGAVIDLSKAAARKLGVKGTAPVEAKVIK